MKLILVAKLPSVDCRFEEPFIKPFGKEPFEGKPEWYTEYHPKNVIRVWEADYYGEVGGEGAAVILEKRYDVGKEP
jgi:hypothetical protein